jgi:hypothetical protein
MAQIKANIKYRLFATDKTGRKHLQIKPDPSLNNWIDLQCPFTAPVAVPVQNSLGHSDIRIIGRSCGNDCPLFCVGQNIPNITEINLKCSNMLSISIAETEQETEQRNSGLYLS